MEEKEYFVIVQASMNVYALNEEEAKNKVIKDLFDDTRNASRFEITAEIS